MPILSAVIIPSKEIKGGKNKVRIAVAHNGETRYIVTDIILDSSKEFKNGSVVKRPDAAILNTKIRCLLQRYQSILYELEYVHGLSCPELVFQLKNSRSSQQHTLGSVFEEFIANSDAKPSSIKVYKIVWITIKRYMNVNVRLEHINRAIILSLIKSLRKHGLAPTTIRHYISILKIVITYAKRCGYVQYKIDPTLGCDLPAPEIRQAWLCVDDIRRIRDLNIPNMKMAVCRDVFMLSYYLGGINVVDLLKINFDENGDTIKYIRTKTERRPKSNKYVEFTIPEEARAIIERYKGADGCLRVWDNPNVNTFEASLSLYMKRIAALAGIKYLIYYSARKSFSQHAFDLGISTSIIEYILGHKLNSHGTSLYSYVNVTPEMATAAVRKVLDNLK